MSDFMDEVDQFAKTVVVKQLGHVYGLVKGPDESDDAFMERVKIAAQYKAELIAKRITGGR